MDKLIMVASKTLKILIFILKNIFKAIGWLWKHRKAVLERSVIALFLAVFLFFITYILANAKPFNEECTDEKGILTVEEDGFVAKHLTLKCEDRKKSGRIIFPEGYNSPKDLFYTFLKEDRPQVSQSFKEHFKNNGYLAVDIATGGKSLNVHVPSYMYLDDDGTEQDVETHYLAYTAINQDTTGLTLILRKVGTDKAFMIGHMAEIFVEDGDSVFTGDIVGKSGGCPDNLQYGERSTGCHVHLEFRVENRPTPYPEYKYSNHNEDLERYRAYKAQEKVGLDEDSKLYSEFGDHFKMLPFILSAQHLQETGRCIDDCPVSNVGARGAMQFMKETWYEYGCDGNGDGFIDVENLEDSICGASNYMTYLFEEKGRGQNPLLHWQWQWWKALYPYNAGYTSEPTHENGIKSAVSYCDNIMSVALSLSEKQ